MTHQLLADCTYHHNTNALERGLGLFFLDKKDMASNKEDNIPLVAVKPHKSSYFRATSCFEEPEVSVKQ